MSGRSKIEWTDATWNLTTGCHKVSQGCKNCAAEREWKRLSHNPQTVYYERQFTDVQVHPERLAMPLGWAKPRKVFIDFMGDLFDPAVPFEFIASAFAVMSVTTRHTYQLLTKQPRRMLEFFKWIEAQDTIFAGGSISNYWPKDLAWKPQHHPNHGGYDNCGPTFPFENIWIGVSVEDQATTDERIPLLLQTPAAVRWISAEPLLGLLDLHRYLPAPELRGFMPSPLDDPQYDPPSLDLVIDGGESGPDARPSHSDWFRSLRDQCAAAGAAYFHKQNGEWVECETEVLSEPPGKVVYPLDDSIELNPNRSYTVIAAHGTEFVRIGKRAAGRLLDGREHSEYPA